MNKIIQYLLLIFTLPLPTSAQNVDLSQIISYLESIKSLGAQFRQVNHDGSISTGTLYIKKPGKLRMTYASPETYIIIVNGEYITILDMKNVGFNQKLSIKKNPLRLLLSSKLELDLNESIIALKSNQSKTTIIVSDTNNANKETLKVIFNTNPLIFEKWIYINSLNEKIAVELTNIDTGNDFNDSLFDPIAVSNIDINKP